MFIDQANLHLLINVRHIPKVVDILRIQVIFFLVHGVKGRGCRRPCWNGRSRSSHAWVERLALHLNSSFGGGGWFSRGLSWFPPYLDMLSEKTALHPHYRGFSYSVIHGLRVNNERWWKKHFTLFLSLPFSVSWLDCYLVLDSYWVGASPVSAKSIILWRKSLKWRLIFNNANANWKWLADLY